MAETTHQTDADGRAMQIVSARRLREILDAEGSDYSRPEEFGPEDTWNVEDDE
jgi:hypothetical protein